ncbi:TIGR04141 family sporadically distributed protein [Marinomonas algicola]|uniref:TIGR04141 family sporadically distributed protein n=1 Tax=Marinomonas algicola TaxID=2773454 RepID=UPI001EFF3D7B|nr:TIGR04141 family sporadically distributed protein [Marinomonas algicola]
MRINKMLGINMEYSAMDGDDKKPYLFLNSFLVKDEYKDLDVSEFLKSSAQVNTYDIDTQHELEGNLFVKIPTEKKPKWTTFTEEVTGVDLDELSNRSSSALLIIKTPNNTMAFIFGYGRFLLDTKYFVHDFGIKTALNTLKHDSLRSVDLFTLDDQAVQKKSQAARESGVGVFGIDISKDVLRAVTGSPKAGVNLKNISGGDSVFSFGLELNIDEISDLISTLSDYYNNDSYKGEFSWVDNIRKIKESSEISNLDNHLVTALKAKNPDICVTIPELVDWDSIWGFSFTRSKNTITPTIDTNDYYANLDVASVSIDSIKRDRLFVYDVHENETEHQIYKSIYFEHKLSNKVYVLFAGAWYEIATDFMTRINTTLSQIPISSLPFPEVYTWSEVVDGKTKHKIETEGDYNERAASTHPYYLLDKKLIKSNRTTTSIELCDLMTANKQYIHVKHRKGGSAGLSHLFAQGSVSAEILLGDKAFRKATRKVLKRVCDGLQNTVPLDNFKSDGVEVVFVILGEDSSTLKDNLPFFSKVNLSKAFESLSQRGFAVQIAGVGTVPKP